MTPAETPHARQRVGIMDFAGNRAWRSASLPIDSHNHDTESSLSRSCHEVGCYDVNCRERESTSETMPAAVTAAPAPGPEITHGYRS